LRRIVGAGIHRAAANDEGVDQRPAGPGRARSRDQRSEISLEILGALLDYPELLAREEVVAGIEHVEGDVAAAIAAVRQALDTGSQNIPEVVLAKLSPSIHPFAAARLAAPRHGRLEEARAELLENVKKLEKLELVRRKTEAIEELERAGRVGADWDEQFAVLAELTRRSKKRHGLEEM
jgi:DNA primase